MQVLLPSSILLHWLAVRNFTPFWNHPRRGVIASLGVFCCCVTYYSYTLCTLCACDSQSELMILKIRESSAHTLFQYNCTPNTSRNGNAYARVCVACRIDSRPRMVNSLATQGILFPHVIVDGVINLVKVLFITWKKDKKCVHVVYELDYLLCAWELWQNNALLLQFWCLTNALTPPVCAFDTSKSQLACIILSRFTPKSKDAVSNLYSIRITWWVITSEQPPSFYLS